MKGNGLWTPTRIHQYFAKMLNNHRNQYALQKSITAPLLEPRQGEITLRLYEQDVWGKNCNDYQ